MNLYKKFKSGKYAGKTYEQVWKSDPSYLHWMADNVGSYWVEIVKCFEKQEVKKKKEDIKNTNKMFSHFTREDIKKFFQENLILGFNMSDFIVDNMVSLTEHQRSEYLKSLLFRNNLKWK